MAKISVSARRKEQACVRLYKAVAHYVEVNGGAVLVSGGIQIQEWPQDNKGVFHIAVKCTGRKPKFGEAVINGNNTEIRLREVTAEDAEAFLRGDDKRKRPVHACGNPDCIVPHPAPHRRPPTIRRNEEGDTSGNKSK